MRWGRNAPGAVLWWICAPNGQNVIMDEFRFQHLDPSEVALVVKQRDAAMRMTTPARYMAAEPRLWDVDRGVTIAELFSRSGLAMSKSSDDRVQGWNATSSLMKATVLEPDSGVPLPALVVSTRCVQLIRMLPLLREGKTNKEDLDASVDACLAEALRVGVMSRPSPTVLTTPAWRPDQMGYALQQAREAIDNDRGEPSIDYVPL